jgi:hypothetical protein
MAPSFLRKYFWDIDFAKVDPKNKPLFFIKRILELGDKKSFDWIKSFYGLNEIRKVVGQKKLSPKSQNFWQNV